MFHLLCYWHSCALFFKNTRKKKKDNPTVKEIPMQVISYKCACCDFKKKLNVLKLILFIDLYSNFILIFRNGF